MAAPLIPLRADHHSTNVYVHTTPHQTTTEAASKPLMVDTGDERAQLYKLATRCAVNPDAVARAVVDCGGDLDTVASLLLAQQSLEAAPFENAPFETIPHTLDTPIIPAWSHRPADGTISPSMLQSGPSSFAFSSLQEGTLSPQSGGLYSPVAAAQPHSPRAMQSSSPGNTPQSPTTTLMHHALFAPPSPPVHSSLSWTTTDDPWATSNPWGAGTRQLLGGGGLWGPPVGGRHIPPPPPPRAVEQDGVPKAALMAAAQVGLEAFEDADLHTMMAALMCG